MGVVSDRERAIYEKNKKEMHTNIHDTNKELNQTLVRSKTSHPTENLEFAIYEGYDPNSKQN